YALPGPAATVRTEKPAIWAHSGATLSGRSGWAEDTWRSRADRCRLGIRRSPPRRTWRPPPRAHSRSRGRDAGLHGAGTNGRHLRSRAGARAAEAFEPATRSGRTGPGRLGSPR